RARRRGRGRPARLIRAHPSAGRSCPVVRTGLAVPCRAQQARAPHRDGPGPGAPHSMTEHSRGETPGRPAPDRLTHIDDAGAARMVDVSGKDVTARTASASGRVLVSPRVIELLRGEGVPKGDALATARIAGIMGAKRTPDLIPLCHPLSVSGVKLDLS